MREATRNERIVQGLLAAMCLAPLLLAFWSGGGLASADKQYALNADEAVLRRAQLMEAGGRSLLLAISATVVAACLGIPAAWALAQRRRPLFLLLVCALPLALPASVAVSGWVRMFAPGAASSFAPPAIKAGQIPRGLLFSPFGAALILGFSLWPLIAFELMPAFRRARSESYDAAVLSGSRLRAFLRIVLPQSSGELAAGVLLTFLLAISDFSVSSLLLIRTLPIEIHDALMLGKTVSAAWAAAPLLLLVTLAALAFSKLSATRRNHGAPVQSPAGAPSSWTAALVLLGGVILGFGAPLAGCVAGIPLRDKITSVALRVGSDSLTLSVRLAAAVALMSGLAAMVRVLAWPDTRTRALNSAGLILLAIPGSFLAAAVFSIQLNASAYLDSVELSRIAALIPAASLGLALLVRFIYVPLRLVEEGLASVDPEVMESAALAGHGRLSVAVSVALPLLIPHIAASTALVFILALGEIPLADRLSPPGATTAMVWLFQQQHMGYDAGVFGLSFLMGVVCAGVLFFTGAGAAVVRKVFHLARPEQIENVTQA
jgi:iron(III) transport system permease protein